MEAAPGKKKNKKKWLWITIGIIIILLIVFRIFLPIIILSYVNKSIKNIPDYRGQVEGVDIQLWKGAILLKKIELIKTGGTTPVPFFAARAIGFDFNWRSLIKRKAIVGNIAVIEPQLTFVKGPTEPETQIEVDWREAVKDMRYIKINRFKINDGKVHFMDITSDPKIDVEINNIQMTAKDLDNRSSKEEQLPSSVKLTADALGGSLEVNMDLAPLAEHPTFELEARVESLNLVKLNDFLRAYGNFDVQKGSFSLYTEVAAKEGRFEGYAKPFFKDLEVLPIEKEEKSLLQTMWETIVAGTKEVLENPKKEQVATRIPISGEFDDPEVNLWNAIGNLLRNAFIQALVPTLDHTVNIDDVAKPEEKNKKNKK